MKIAHQHLPLVVVGLLIGAALWYGPIAQWPDYHNFADQRVALGIPHFADVASNIGFALVAAWGGCALPRSRHDAGLTCGWAGYRLFLLGLFLTAFGSGYYHLAPDNARLVWDRLPIALACGGLLAGVWGDAKGQSSAVLAAWLALLAIYSVVWWHVTELAGNGDLRPYLLLQALPMLLIPLWQWLYRAPAADRLSFGAALLLYAIAKAAELYDHQIAAATGLLTGHTIKHLLATVAAAVIVARLSWRVRPVNA
ncbi:MAG: hypothetical protein QMB52_08880 [Propionivibrio sp.]